MTTHQVPCHVGLIPYQYQALAKYVRVGDRVLLVDGIMKLEVESVQNTEIRRKVV